MTLYEHKGTFPSNMRWALVVCLILISTSVDVATFRSRYLTELPFPSSSLAFHLIWEPAKLEKLPRVKCDDVIFLEAPILSLWSFTHTDNYHHNRLFLNQKSITQLQYVHLQHLHRKISFSADDFSCKPQLYQKKKKSIFQYKMDC